MSVEVVTVRIIIINYRLHFCIFIIRSRSNLTYTVRLNTRQYKNAYRYFLFVVVYAYVNERCIQTNTYTHVFELQLSSVIICNYHILYSSDARFLSDFMLLDYLVRFNLIPFETFMFRF